MTKFEIECPLAPRLGVKFMRKCVLLALPFAAAFAAMSSPASAALVLVSPCSTANISPTATACAGWFDGNLLNNGGTNVQDQIDALAMLGYTWNGD
jgi:hypothetical protein